MTELTDWQLLERYAEGADQAAFAQLVKRHIDLVHGCARRSLGNGSPHIDDVVQAVFLLLSEKAGRIRQRGAMEGWLFRCTRFCCANVIKTERRRKIREREVSEMRDQSQPAGELEPILDESIASLGEKERQVILVHYLQRRTLADSAAILGISRDAAEKRVERGLARLREFFRRRGYTAAVGGVTGVLGVESAKAAPPALLARVGTGKAVAAGSVVRAIANGADQMMRWIQIKFAAALVGIVLMVGLVGAVVGASISRRHAPSPPPPPAAGGPVALAGVAGRRPMMVRWDLIMNDAGAQRIISAMKAEKTASVGYSAYSGTTAKLRAAIGAGPLPANANEDGYDILHYQRLNWADLNDGRPRGGSDSSLARHDGDFRVTLGPDPNNDADINIVDTNAYSARATKDGVHLDISGAPHDASILFTDGSRATTKAGMAYAGDVPSHSAVVFALKLADHAGDKIWDITILETFDASTAEYFYLKNADAKSWIVRGPDKALADADQAIAWNSGGRDLLDRPAPEFEKHLDNGATVRLAAVCRPDQWPNCWWDASGNAVAVNPGINSSTQYLASDKRGVPTLQIGLTAEDASITGHEVKDFHGTLWLDTGFDEERAFVTRPAFEGDAVEVGVAAGPWKDGGKITMGQEVVVAGVRIKAISISQALPKSGTLRGSSYIKAEMTRSDDVEIEIVGHDKQNREITREDSETILRPDIRLEHGKSDRMIPSQWGCAGVPEDIASFAVKWRPRQWVTFKGFAANPLTAPPDAVAKGKVAATSRPAPGTPEALHQDLAAAMASGDAKKVRALTIPAKDEIEGQYADAMIEMMMATDAVRIEAGKKFGASETQTAMGGMFPPIDDSSIARWKIEGDQAIPIYKNRTIQAGGGKAALVRIDGQWKTPIGLPENLTDEMKASLKAFLPQLAAQGKALRALAGDIAAGKYKDAYEARDALVAARENRGK